MHGSTSFLRALPSAEKEELLKLTSLDELPKSRYATKLAVTAYPTARRGRKAVFSHIEVYKMVETIAGRMREAGIRPGTVCAFALPTSFESIIYFYALMWIAAVAAPIDPNLEQEKFNDELKRVGAKVLVSPYVPDDTENKLYVKCHNAATELQLLEWHIHRTINEGVILETHGSMIGTGAAWAGGAGDFKLDPEEIALHIPSAVAVVPLSHRALCAAAKSFASTYNLAVNMSTMLAPPLHTIHGVLILIAAFYSGGHIVLPGYGGFEADKFWDLAKKHDITWLSASQDQILQLYEENEKNTASRQQLTFVRSCGDRCIAPELVFKVETSLKTPVYESYGTPEACGFATANREGCTNAGTVGKAVDGIEVAIFDVNSREMCQNYQEGEITVSGAHVAQGYLNSEMATEAAVFKTERTVGDGESEVVHWFATGDRGSIDDDGYVTVIGDSKTLRAAEIAAQEERKAREAEEAEKVAIAEKEREEAAAAEAAAAAAVAAVQKEEEEKAKAEEEARLREEERLAEEKRKEEEAAEEEVRKKEAEEEERRLMEEEEMRLKEEEEERRKEEEEKAAAAAAAEAAAEAEAAEAKANAEAEAEAEALEKEKEETMRADRLIALERAGIENPQDLDEETANAILARLEAIEENHRKLQEDVEGRNAAELEDMKRRVAEAEAEAERAATDKVGENGQVVDVRMEELEAAVMAAAASAESSASNTREAVKAAKEVADAAYGTNQSQPVEVKASTGDQGALTKTVRVPLDDVESAMRNHPAVEMAKAFGRKDRRFGAEVFCAIVPKRGARVSETWLKLFAQSALPAPMVPKKFYYIEKLPEGISRRELSESPLLQDLSSFSGFSEVKHVKGPQWKPKRRVGP